MCGKDSKNNFEVNYRFGYDSNKRDGDYLLLHLCGECLDCMTDKLVESCKHNPITENEDWL